MPYAQGVMQLLQTGPSTLARVLAPLYTSRAYNFDLLSCGQTSQEPPLKSCCSSLCLTPCPSSPSTSYSNHNNLCTLSTPLPRQPGSSTRESIWAKVSRLHRQFGGKIWLEEGAGRTDLGAVQAEGPVVTVGSCEEGQGEARSVKGAQHNVEFNMR